MRSVTYLEIDLPDFEIGLNDVLLQFEGADASTTFTDDSARVWTARGNAQIDTAQFKFGASSGYFDGAGDYIDTPDDDTMEFGSEDFTIDFWFRCSVVSGNAAGIIGKGASTMIATPAGGSFLIRKNTSNQIEANFMFGSTLETLNSTTLFTNAVNTGWHHVALVRKGTTIYMFIDGVLEDSEAVSGSINNVTNLLTVGRDGDVTNYWFGHIDELRIKVGHARWSNNFTPPTRAIGSADTTLRFAMDTNYLPAEIEAIPSLTDISFTPAMVSIGGDLGQRATLSATFKDHKHIFYADDYENGTFWGKFRARYGNRLRGSNVRWIVGLDDEAFADMETRHFVIESMEGPFPNATFSLVAKDVLKFADNDRALAPVPSNGILNTTMTTSTTSITLSPTGIGNLEYPASGHINIGGQEIVSFTRSGDNLTVTRAQKNTVAVAHDQGERMQLVLTFTGVDPAEIIETLLVDYAGVDPDYIDIDEWLNETETFFQRVFTTDIAEPTGVATLVSEIIEQAALILWWDDVQLKLRLKVIRPIVSSTTLDESTMLAGSFAIQEQPNLRLSQVFTYFNMKNPIKGVSDVDNFKSAVLTVDLDAEDAYGASIKTIYSRWISSGGRDAAERINDILLARFKDAPRKFSFDLFRYGGVSPSISEGYNIENWTLQDEMGDRVSAPAQVNRINVLPDRLQIEAQEMLYTSVILDDPYDRTIVIDADQNNVNLRTLHDSLYTAPDGVTATTITCIIESGVTVGSELPTDGSTPQVSFNVGTWPAATTLFLIINGEIIGHGGNGGQGGDAVFGNGRAGKQGGTAIYTRKAISIENNNAIRGGGGGGGGGCGVSNGAGGGGGGGTGWNPGNGGIIGTGGNPAVVATAGAQGLPLGTGLGGNDARGDTPIDGQGGAGGTYGTAGSNGQRSGTTGGTGGAAGVAIDGVSYVTMSGAGVEQGSQIN